ncbi:hypothetical protein EDD11_002356 [Mortierella claussenii]|nr:hypothetical protein EDD11_002356 [Mortierella claussenii]
MANEQYFEIYLNDPPPTDDITSSCCNELSRIPAEIGFLRNLTLLDLSKNKLTSLPESIMHLTKLVDLKLSGNQLETLPAGIGGLVKLAALSLDDNQLESLPPQIGLIKGLISLDLTNNPITVLPAEVGKLQFLRRLHLDGCPLVRKFEHQPLHSPPTLLELAARVMVRHDVPVPPMTLPHLKTYLKSAHTCSFCDGPYFDSWVKRGKMIEKNEMLIPLEYTLCQPHWNTEMERIKLLFCQRPITAPPTKPSTAVTQSSLARSKGGDKKTMVKRQSSRAAEAYSTLEVDYQSSTASSAATTPASEIPPPVPTTSFPATTPVRPRARKFASDSDDRARPLSLIGSRLSMLLSSKGDKRERPAATSRTTSLPVVTTAASVMGTAGSSTTTLLPSAPTFYPVSSSSSSSAGPSCNRAPAPAPVVSLLNAEEPTATIAPVRPTARRAATNNFLARAAFKLTRPLSMGSSAFESMGRLSTSATSLNPPLSASATAD